MNDYIIEPTRWRIAQKGTGKTLGWCGKSNGTFHYEWGKRVGTYPTLTEAIDGLFERMNKRCWRKVMPDGKSST